MMMHTTEPLPFHIDGLNAWIESYAIHDDTLLSLGLLGRAAILEAIAATLMTRPTFSLDTYEHLHWPHAQSTPLRRFRKSLPSGHTHYLWVPLTTFPTLFAPGTPAYLLVRDQVPTTPPPMFAIMLNRLLACPILPEWIPALWHWGLATEWIQPTISLGLTLWKIDPIEENCVEWIQEHLRTGRLSINSPSNLSVNNQPLAS